MKGRGVGDLELLQNQQSVCEGKRELLPTEDPIQTGKQELFLPL